MRILFDQGTPVPLRGVLTSHQVSTAFEMGWANLENGDLLREAEDQFDVFITTDQSRAAGSGETQFREAESQRPSRAGASECN